MRSELAGSVLFVFQPAEERATGARAMLADGVLENHKPAAILALHTAPLNVGQLATGPGTVMAWRDRVSVKLTGSGELEAAAKAVRKDLVAVGTLGMAEAARPVAGDFVFAQIGPARQSDGEWTVGGTLTTASRSASAAAKSAIETALASLDHPGVSASLDYQEKWIAGVTNDPALTQRAIASASTIVGDDGVLLLSSVIPAFSEDFGSFQELVPGVMFFLGVSNPEKGWVGMPHSPGYMADEESIFVGARSMAAVLLEFLSVD